MIRQEEQSTLRLPNCHPRASTACHSKPIIQDIKGLDTNSMQEAARVDNRNMERVVVHQQKPCGLRNICFCPKEGRD